MLTQIYTFIHTYLIECRTKEEFVGKNHQLATIDPKIESNSRRIKQGGKTNDFLTLLFTLLALQFITFAFFLFISIIFIPFFFFLFTFILIYCSELSVDSPDSLLHRQSLLSIICLEFSSYIYSYPYMVQLSTQLIW